MESSINHSAIAMVLILMATVSLFIMLSLNQIGYIVNGDLYNFGLQFSYRWAMPYWVYSGIIFGLSWGNIFLSIAMTAYIFRKRRKGKLDTMATPEIVTTPQTVTTEATKQPEEKEQKQLNEFLELKKEDTTSREEIAAAATTTASTTSEKVGEEEIKQPEEITQPIETANATEEEQNAQLSTERAPAPEKEKQEVSIPPEEVENRQSVP